MKLSLTQKRDMAIGGLFSFLMICGIVTATFPGFWIGSHESPSTLIHRESCFSYAQRWRKSDAGIKRVNELAQIRAEREKDVFENLIEQKERENRIEKAARGPISDISITMNLQSIRRIKAEIAEIVPEDFVRDVSPLVFDSYHWDCKKEWDKFEYKVRYAGGGILLLGIVGLVNVLRKQAKRKEIEHKQ